MVFLCSELCRPQALTMRQNRNAVHRVSRWQIVGDKGMTALMNSDHAPICFTHHERPPRTELYAYQCLLETHLRERVKVMTRGTERCFIDQVRQVCPAHACCLASQLVEAHSVIQWGVASMHPEDRLAPSTVRERDGDVTVEATRRQQRPIQHVNTVGCGQHNDSAATNESIQLDQQLVERLIAFPGVSDAYRTLAAYRINFIKKDDTGSVLARLPKEVAHTTRSHAHKQLNELGRAHGEERHARLTSHGFGQQRLSRSRWADKQDPTWDVRPQTIKAFWAAQELHELFQISTDFIDTRHIGKGH